MLVWNAHEWGNNLDQYSCLGLWIPFDRTATPNKEMPPKFPHGLTKDPTIMSRPELAIFGALVGSMGIGVYQLITSPWAENSLSNSSKNDSSSTTSPTTTIFTTSRDSPMMSVGEDGDVTKVDFGKSRAWLNWRYNSVCTWLGSGCPGLCSSERTSISNRHTPVASRCVDAMWL